MARPLRIHPPGGYHHVTARGNDRLPIFIDDVDRWSFLRLLAEAKQRFGCHFHAYCLMTNHVHLVVEDHQGTLSKALRHIKGVHAQRFNRHHGRTGHLFEGRFWNSLLGDDAYLTTAIEYVHRNPVEAGLVGSAEDYPWSSYPAYSGKTGAPACLTVDKILQLHGGRRALAERTEGLPSAGGVLEEFRQERMPPVLGTDAFRESAIAAAETTAGTTASARRGLPTRSQPSLASIQEVVARDWSVSPASLSFGRRGSRNTPRSVAVHLAHEAGLPLDDIAQFFGLSSSNAVSTSNTRLVRQFSDNPDLRRRVHHLQVVVDGT